MSPAPQTLTRTERFTMANLVQYFQGHSGVGIGHCPT